MFRENKRHLQPLLISHVNDLPAKQRQLLTESWADTFYRECFCRIDEGVFAVLYADVPSRPNIPVNVLIGLEILKAGFGWSDEQLYEAFVFDMRVRYALGYHQLGDEGAFDLRTLYNFRQRLSHYNQEQGSNLLAQAFRQITDLQLEAFKLHTNQQRMDSTQIASNMVDASRLQLLVEALQRVQRMLSESDRARYADLLSAYCKGTSGQYVYRIKGQDATDQHLQAIGQVMYRLVVELEAAYGQQSVYQMLCHFFVDNFQLACAQVQLKPNDQISANSLQSVDDLEATFRRKGNQTYKGYVANVTETCSPDNELQLITHLQVAPNTVDDAGLLVQAVPELKARTELDTLYTDGGFGSPAADKMLLEHHVEQVQTAIRGTAPDPQRFSLADFAIEQEADGRPVYLTCPHGQRVAVQPSRTTGYLAAFDPLVCAVCPAALEGRCRARPGKRDPRFKLSFTTEEVNWAARRRRSRARAGEAKNRRAAVEATVRVLKHPFRAGHLPVRGLFRVTCMMLGAAAMVNVRSIYRYGLAQAKATRRQMMDAGEQRSSSTDPVRPLLSAFSAFWTRLWRPLASLKTVCGC
jgi:hypothetical protein